MAIEMTPANILQLAQICQYQSAVGVGSNIALDGGDIDPSLTRLIYIVRSSIQNRYNLNPSDATLQATSNYLYSLLHNIFSGINIFNKLRGVKPAFTGPSNQSTTVGGSVTFGVSITAGVGPFSYQWYLSGVPIAGATNSTYVISNAQLSQNGNVYSVAVANPAGTVFSNTATLTVTASLSASYYYGTTDYSSQLLSNSDVVPYLGTFPITTGQPLSFTWPSGAANNQFIVVRYPATESVKTSYANAPLNNGIIPGIAFNAVVTFGGFNYIFSRTGNPFSQNTTNPLIFS
jgi:hypothetical protein